MYFVFQEATSYDIFSNNLKMANHYLGMNLRGVHALIVEFFAELTTIYQPTIRGHQVGTFDSVRQI